MPSPALAWVQNLPSTVLRSWHRFLKMVLPLVSLIAAIRAEDINARMTSHQLIHLQPAYWNMMPAKIGPMTGYRSLSAPRATVYSAGDVTYPIDCSKNPDGKIPCSRGVITDVIQCAWGSRHDHRANKRSEESCHEYRFEVSCHSAWNQEDREQKQGDYIDRSSPIDLAQWC